MDSECLSGDGGGEGNSACYVDYQHYPGESRRLGARGASPIAKKHVRPIDRPHVGLLLDNMKPSQHDRFRAPTIASTLGNW